jgi:DNA-binding MarR family transcriptional regulator
MGHRASIERPPYRVWAEQLAKYEPVSEDTILLAIARAERYAEENPWDETGVYWRPITEHLGVVHSAATTRKLRPQIEGLIDAGLVVKTRNRGRERWGLTDAGRDRAARASREGARLPASPAQLEWKAARQAAAESIESIREQLAKDLREAGRLLDAEGSDSDYYDMAENIAREARRLGGALFCLDDWPEPDDEHPDVDRSSMRNARVRAALSGLFPLGGRAGVEEEPEQ